MPETARYYVNGFLLKIFDSAYLVEVKPANGETGRYEESDGLPEWIFRSPHSIWVAEEETPQPLMVRAKKGEDLKNKILLSLIRSEKNEKRAKRKTNRPR
jgi:hypothetical protein